MEREVTRLEIIRKDAERAQEIQLTKEQRIEARFKAIEDRLEKIENLARLESVKAKVDARPETVMPEFEPKPAFRFKVPFLQAERLVNEDLNDADRRLFGEYTQLELNRPLEPADDARWRLLQAGFFEFRG